MTVSDTHADTIRETRRERCERIFNVDACVRLARSTPDYYDSHGNYLPDVAWLLNETRAEVERERARADRLADALEPVLCYAEGERARADRAEAALEPLAEALGWALDVLEISLKRLDTIEEQPYSDEHLRLRDAGLAKARAALSAGSGDGNTEAAKPEGWPDKCGRCGAPWERLSFDPADGFCCSSCGGCDSDE